MLITCQTSFSSSYKTLKQTLGMRRAISIQQSSHDNFTIQFKSLAYHFIILNHVTKSYKHISLHSYHKTKLNRFTWHFRSKNRSRRYKTLLPGPPFWRLGARNVLQIARQQSPVAWVTILSLGCFDWVQNCQVAELWRLGASHMYNTANLKGSGTVWYFWHNLSCRPLNWVKSAAHES
jgi:hypothetical protein